MGGRRVQFRSPHACALFSSPTSHSTTSGLVGPRGARELVRRVANRAGVSKAVTPRVRRHAWATLAPRKDLNLAAVQTILGHDRLTTTAIYLNLTDTHIVEKHEAKW